ASRRSVVQVPWSPARAFFASAFSSAASRALAVTASNRFIMAHLWVEGTSCDLVRLVIPRWNAVGNPRSHAERGNEDSLSSGHKIERSGGLMKRLRIVTCAAVTLGVALVLILRAPRSNRSPRFASPEDCIQAYAEACKEGDVSSYLDCLAEPLRSQRLQRAG